MRDKHFAPESFWARRSGWLAIAVAVVVSGLGYLLDGYLVLQGIPRGAMLLVTNTVTGIVAGVLFYQLARHQKAQHEMVRARMQTIAEMNHHIRNALQVIAALSAVPSERQLSEQQIQLINQSVERVEWALREVLPKSLVGEETSHSSDTTHEIPRKPHQVA